MRFKFAVRSYNKSQLPFCVRLLAVQLIMFIVLNDFRAASFSSQLLLRSARQYGLACLSMAKPSAAFGNVNGVLLGANATELTGTGRRRSPYKLLDMSYQTSSVANQGAGSGGPPVTRDITLSVQGLHCGNCASTCESILRKTLEGVADVQVSLTMQTAKVKVSGAAAQAPAVGPVAEALAALEQSGFPSEVAKLSEKQDEDDAAAFLLPPGALVVSAILEGLDSVEAAERLRACLAPLRPLRASAALLEGAAALTLPPGTDGGDVARRLEAAGFPALRLTAAVVGADGRVPQGMEGGAGPGPSPLERFRAQEAAARRALRQGAGLLAASLLAHFAHHVEHIALDFPEGLAPAVAAGLHGALPLLTGDAGQAALALAAFAGPGRPFLLDGWRALFGRGDPNMNTLLSLGALAAFGSSAAALLRPGLGFHTHFSDPVMIFGFLLVGQAVEARARLRAARGLQRLFDRRARTALLAADPAAGRPTDQEVPAESLCAGALVRVLPGAAFPADGRVEAGRSAAEEGALTGEAAPVPKGPGDKVSAGTVNLDGPLLVRVTRPARASLLSQILALVEEAQARKAPAQTFADKVAGRFCWGVMGAAAATLAFWGLVGAAAFPEAAAAALGAAAGQGQGGAAASAAAAGGWALGARLAADVLVVSCPCALGLATPIAMLVGSAAAAERGLLVKGADVLEAARDLRAVVFDKTGTLTAGRPVVEEVAVLSEGENEFSILTAAMGVEWGTTHPLALAIQQAVQEREILINQANYEGHQTYPGMGATAIEVSSGATVVVGNVALLDEHNVFVDDQAHEVARRFGAEGKTAIYVAVGGRLVGLVGCTDALRPEAPAVVAALRAQGLQVRLLTGDRAEVALAAARRLGLRPEEVIANVRPARKALAVRALAAELGGPVAMVGDGVNDAPALAAAGVGVAVGGGADVAGEAADAVLTRETGALEGVVGLVQLGRDTLRKVRSNLLLALGYNLVAVPLAAGALLPLGVTLPPGLAAALHSSVSLLVIANSVRLGGAAAGWGPGAAAEGGARASGGGLRRLVERGAGGKGEEARGGGGEGGGGQQKRPSLGHSGGDALLLGSSSSSNSNSDGGGVHAHQETARHHVLGDGGVGGHPEKTQKNYDEQRQI